MNVIISATEWVFARLNTAGDYVSMLVLRLLLAYEYWDSGITKFYGGNWFAEIQDQFPFPFNLVSTDASWFLATWSELLGAVALVIGLGTRFFSVALIILTVVAWVSVHAGNGYNVCSNGFKLPLMFLVMYIPLLLNGPGRLSLDHLIARRFKAT